MKIAKYIGDLLYDYECVVIPGLGGFLTNEKPASIHPVTHHFRPPYKQILFNSFLKTNDGLLLNYIAREEGVSYKDAKEQLDHFVYQCNNALKEGKRINFHKVGYLYLNKQEQISFEQDSSINYDAEAFGLGAFVSPAVRRTKAEEKIREMVTKEPMKTSSKKELKKPQKSVKDGQGVKHHSGSKLRASRQRSPYRVQFAFLSLLIFAMLVGWGFMNKDKVGAYYNNYSSVIPLFYSNSNAYLINNADRLPISKFSNSKSGLWIVNVFEGLNKKLSGKIESDVVHTASEKVVEKTNNNLAKANLSKEEQSTPASTILTKPIENVVKVAIHEPVVAEPKSVSPPVSKKRESISTNIFPVKHFYILAGSFRDKGNAFRLVNQLKAKGFHATEAGLTPDGLYRVAYADFERRDLAEKQLLGIRQRENPSAWILEK